MGTLVTGAAGFIGRSLVLELTKAGHSVIAFDSRYRDLGTRFVQGDVLSFDFDEILKDADAIFHLAGLLGTSELFHRIEQAEKVNVLGTLRLLEAMRRSDVDRIVFTSKPNVWKHNVYTVTKENCERYLEMYREIYGFKVVTVRPFNVYGPFEYLEEYRKAIPYFIVAALRSEPLEVFGDGEQTMDAIYVDDVATALRLCNDRLPRETVEIGSSKPVKVNDLAIKIIELTGSRSKIIHKPMRKGETLDVQEIRANGNMEKLLGFAPKTELEDGLRTTIGWYKEHINEFTEIYMPKEDDFWHEDDDSDRGWDH